LGLEKFVLGVLLEAHNLASSRPKPKACTCPSYAYGIGRLK
jgi:hypothetical protein